MSTSQPPDRKRRNSKVFVAVVAVVLIVAAVIIHVLKPFGSREGFVDDRFQFSDAWVNGGERAWTIPGIPETIDGPVAARLSRMVVVTKDVAEPNGRVLTGYDIRGNEPVLDWTRNIVIDPELEGPVVLTDIYVVYAGQLLGAADGRSYESPWPHGAKVVIDSSWGNMVACVPSGDCSSTTGDMLKESLRPFEGTDIAPIVQDDLQLFTLMYSTGVPDSQGTMINARTGEWMRLKAPLDDVSELAALRGGWLTHDSNFRSVLISLDGSVEVLGGYSAGTGDGTADEKQRLVITPGTVPTVDDIRLQYAPDENPGKDRIVGEFDRARCTFTVNGSAVDLSKEKSGSRSLEGAGTDVGSGDAGSELPVGAARGSGGGVDGGVGAAGSATGCDRPASFIATSLDGNLVSTLVQTEKGAMDYALLDASTGEVTWRVPQGDAVVVPRPDLALTLDDGVLTGWKPRK
ncbi:MAG: hypothetical protein QM705_00250 [Ancrocorticia sp.]